MLKASLIIEDYLKDNAVFKKNSSLNRDNTSDRYIKLKQQLKLSDIDISTSDINTVKESKIIIYVNVPKSINFKKDKLYVLFLVENVKIWPRNKNQGIITRFDLVFTWNDLLIDNINFFKFNLSYSQENFLFKTDNKRDKLLTAIYSKKYQKNSLYKNRLDLIKVLEDKKGFDLYGTDWDLFRFNLFPFTFFNRFNFLKKIMKPFMFKPVNYRGQIEDKLKLMSKYKFSLAFENNRFPGYITEKLFHPMMAGSIPVYLGAQNIKLHVPENCYIDYEQFTTTNEFWDFIINMTEDDVMCYRRNIEKFLRSKNFKPFDSQSNAIFISRTIIKKYESIF